MPATPQQKHDAGRHLVVAHALLHGYAANLVGASTYVEVNGHPAVVKMAGQGAWMVDPIDKFLAGEDACYALVDASGPTTEFYLVPGPDLRVGVLERYEAFLAEQGGSRPRNPDSKHAAITPAHVSRWKDNWDIFAA
jgi:hypothetical protein